jgi:hypothetical protein
MNNRNTAFAAVAFATAFVAWWSMRWLAIGSVAAGRSISFFGAAFLVVAAVLFSLGLVRLVRTGGRPDGMTWWLVTAPATLLIVPLAAAVWLMYLLVTRRVASRVRQGMAIPGASS